MISVSAGTGCYRHIQISAKATLYQLHEVIIRAFEFEDDHEHAFFMDNRFWSQEHAFYSEKLKRDKVFIFVNIRSYFSDEEMLRFMDTTSSQGYST